MFSALRLKRSWNSSASLFVFYINWMNPWWSRLAFAMRILNATVALLGRGQKRLSQMHNGRVKSPAAAAGLIHRVRQAENCKLRRVALSAMRVSHSLCVYLLFHCARPMWLRPGFSLCVQRVCVSGAIKLAHIWRDAGSKIASLGHLTLSLSQLKRERERIFDLCRDSTGRGASKVLISNIYTLLFLCWALSRTKCVLSFLHP